MLPKSLLSKVRMLHRSLTIPISGFACSQKYQKHAASSSCRSASSFSEKSLGPTIELGGRSRSSELAAPHKVLHVAKGIHAAAPAIRFNISRRDKLMRLRRSPAIEPIISV